MEHSCSVLPNVGTRERINGLRKIPKGTQLNIQYLKYEDAVRDANGLNRSYMSTKFNYAVSGVKGNYCIIRYENEPVVDTRFAYITNCQL